MVIYFICCNPNSLYNIFQIKMVGSIGASQVCENLLNNVKSSNLNYLVNETPYSAFITIRKKLLRHIEERETGDVTFAADIITNADIALTQENLALKIRC